MRIWKFSRHGITMRNIIEKFNWLHHWYEALHCTTRWPFRILFIGCYFWTCFLEIWSLAVIFLNCFHWLLFVENVFIGCYFLKLFWLVIILHRFHCRLSKITSSSPAWRHSPTTSQSAWCSPVKKGRREKTRRAPCAQCNCRVFQYSAVFSPTVRCPIPKQLLSATNGLACF